MALSDKEKQLKSILSEEHFDIDTDILWQGVKHQIPQQKRKHKALFWLYGGVSTIVFLSITAWGFLHTDDNNIKIENSATIETATSIDFEQETLNTNNLSKESSDLHQETVSKEPKIIKTPSLLINNVATAKKPNQTLENEKIDLNTTRPIEPTYTQAQQLTWTNLKNIRKEKAINISAQNRIDKINALDHNSLKTKTAKRKMVMADITTLPGISPKEVTIIQELPNLNHQIKPIKHRKFAPIFFEFSAGGNYSFGDWASKNGELEQKLTSERSVIGLSGHLSAGYSFNKNWDIIVGLSMSQSVYRYTNNSIENYSVSEDGVLEIIIDENGNQQDITGSLATELVVNQELQWHRKHRFLDGGISLRYRLDLSPSLYSSLQAGLFYTINQSHSGYYKDATTISGIHKFTQEEDHPYSASPLGFSTGIGIHKKMGSIDLGLRLGLRYRPSNQLAKSALYTLKNSQTDLQIGIIYRPEWD